MKITDIIQVVRHAEGRLSTVLEEVPEAIGDILADEVGALARLAVELEAVRPEATDERSG